MTSTQSRKAKGRRLQKWVVAQILRIFPELTPNDVRSTSMGAQGVDVQLSEKGLQLFPFSVECKNQEASKQLYDWYEQSGVTGYTPLLVVKKNNKEPLVVMDAVQFMEIIKNARRQ
jgi:hypothetical protein